MVAALTEVSPWLDNWAIERQLWNPGDRLPGAELNLVPTNRNLMVQWRDRVTNQVVLAFTEFQSNTPIAITNTVRGLVEVALSGDAWRSLNKEEAYRCEIIAYGFLYDWFTFSAALPAVGTGLLNGVEIYGSPSQILEIMGQIPGADVQTALNLSGQWQLDARGYWNRSIDSDQSIHGFFVNGLHAKQVPYSELGIGCDRQWARVAGTGGTDTIYYKGHENLADPSTVVETAFSAAVLRSLEQATAQINRYTGTLFSKVQIYRELHRTPYRQKQVFTRVVPVTVDRYFRLDCYSSARSLVRRYTEESVFNSDSFSSDDQLMVESQTGTITLTRNFYDWIAWSTDDLGSFYDSNYFPAGEANLEITYTAGFDRPPIEIEEAAAYLAAMRQARFWQTSMTQGLQGLSIGCVSLNFGELFSKYFPEWERQANSILDGYTRHSIEIL